MKDQYGRTIDYMRISVTDRCNLRCRYCMPPEGVPPVSHEEILRFDEILRLTGLFAEAGIRKIKITGGEPLVRRGVVSLIRDIKKVVGIEEVTLTTNGIAIGQRPQLASELAEAGISSINISLDTLNPQRYRELTGTDGLENVLRALDACCAISGLRVKVNVVTLADYNMYEIGEMAALARDRAVDIRFIEMMPMGLGKEFRGYGQTMILQKLEEVYGNAEVYNGAKLGNGPAIYYQFQDFCGRVGFVSAMTHGFCEDCNRIRLTSEGFLKPCLQYSDGTDLRNLLRNGSSDDVLKQAIEVGIYEKPRQHSFASQNPDHHKDEKNMSFIGG